MFSESTSQSGRIGFCATNASGDAPACTARGLEKTKASPLCCTKNGGLMTVFTDVSNPPKTKHQLDDPYYDYYVDGCLVY